MLRKASFVLAALTLMLVASMAQAKDCSLAIGGGLSIPMGDFSKQPDLTATSPVGLDAALGYFVNPEFDYALNDKFSIGVDGTWGTNKLSNDGRDKLRTASGDPSLDAKYTQIGGAVHGKWMMPMQNSPLSPYLVAGAGIMNFKGKIDSSNPTFADEKTKSGFAGRVGVGAGYKIGGQGTIGVEGDYNFVSLKKDDFGVSSAPSIGVKAVLGYTFKTGAAASK